jgi:hypothetical protein
VIGWDCFTWIDEVMDSRESYVAMSDLLGPEVLGSNIYAFSPFPAPNACIQICITACGTCQFKLLF